MTLMLDLTPEMELRLQKWAAAREQAPAEFVLSVLEMLLVDESEEAVFDDMRGLINRSLQKLWDNDEDAVYDHL